MKALVAEDDITSRLLLRELLRGYGNIYLAENGKEAVKAVAEALRSHHPFDLVCLDIMMPEMDGQIALQEIRLLEERADRGGAKGAKILMTTALHDRENVTKAFSEQCAGYLVKPIDRTRFLGYMRQFGFTKD